MVKNKKGVKGKKGQVFLVAAIILGLALVSVTVKHNTAREYPITTDYEELSRNYLTEAPKIINYAKYNDLTEEDELKAFTEVYREAALQKDPNFGIFYAFKDSDGKIHIVNTLNNRVMTIVITDSTDSSGTPIIQEEIYGTILSGGSTCIAGLGCTSTNTEVTNFGGEFSNEGDLNLANLLTEEQAETALMQICLEKDADGNPITCTEPLQSRTLLALTNSQEPVTSELFPEVESFRVDVTIQQG